MPDQEEEYEEGEEETEEEREEGEGQQQVLEGFFDYKNLMINPAAVQRINKTLNRDLQLGNLNKEDFKIVFLHLHLGMDLKRFPKLKAAANFILQRGFAHLIMSNSRGGFLRKQEGTTTRIRRILKGEGTGGGWLRWRKKKE